jgi:hypothetical protein
VAAKLDFLRPLDSLLNRIASLSSMSLEGRHTLICATPTHRLVVSFVFYRYLLIQYFWGALFEAFEADGRESGAG